MAARRAGSAAAAPGLWTDRRRGNKPVQAGHPVQKIGNRPSTGNPMPAHADRTPARAKGHGSACRRVESRVFDWGRPVPNSISHALRIRQEGRLRINGPSQAYDSRFQILLRPGSSRFSVVDPESKIWSCRLAWAHRTPLNHNVRELLTNRQGSPGRYAVYQIPVR